jgi:hypothetical protein
VAENINEITITYEDEGETVIEELDKIVLTKGPWSTILFRYKERDRKTGTLGPPKATIKRYQKHQGVYKKRDSINLTAKTAKMLADMLYSWLNDGLLGDQDGTSD